MTFEELWETDITEIARQLYDGASRGGTFGDSTVMTRSALLDGKVAAASIDVARWTKWLALATFSLAVATVALAVITVVK